MEKFLSIVRLACRWLLLQRIHIFSRTFFSVFHSWPENKREIMVVKEKFSVFNLSSFECYLIIFNNMLPISIISMNMMEQKKNVSWWEGFREESARCLRWKVSIGIFSQFHFKFPPIDDIATSIKKHSHLLLRLIYIHSMSLDILFFSFLWVKVNAIFFMRHKNNK